MGSTVTRMTGSTLTRDIAKFQRVKAMVAHILECTECAKVAMLVSQACAAGVLDDLESGSSQELTGSGVPRGWKESHGTADAFAVCGSASTRNRAVSGRDRSAALDRADEVVGRRPRTRLANPASVWPDLRLVTGRGPANQAGGDGPLTRVSQSPRARRENRKGAAWPPDAA